MPGYSAIAFSLGVAVALWSPVIGQVSTNVPEVVPGARPVTVERIKIHGRAGTVEGVDVSYRGPRF